MRKRRLVCHIRISFLLGSHLSAIEDVLQKLGQSCLMLSTNTGRVYRPKDSDRLILYLKDLNLPKPDKWGTCMLISFLQQLVTYQGA